MARGKSEKNTEKKRVVLLDAQSVLHRAYHALPDFSSSKGEATGALYGLSLMLIKIITELKPDYIFACFDVAEPTYRHAAYDGYKAGRKKAEQDLIDQITRSKDVFKAFNIPVYEKAGYEADDLLGTIVEELKDKQDKEVIIASGDMDTMQLVSGKKVRVYTLKKGIKDTILYDEKAVQERFGFGSNLLPDYKGLRGDPSDNIIGIPGIGEKTATTLIQNFGSLEDIYKALKKDEKSFEKAGIKPRIVELLKNSEEEAMFSKMLATIKKDVPIEFELPSESWKDDFKTEKVSEIFSQLEFRGLKDRISDLNNGGKVDEKKSEPQKENQGLFDTGVSKNKEREVALALWLIDSNITNPTVEDILNFAKTKSFDEAEKIIFKELEKRGLKKLFEEIEKPLIPVIEKMEKRGVKINASYLESLSKEYHKTLSKLEKEIWEKSGTEFNLNSPKQLSQVLFESLNIKAKNQKKTSTGAKSTRESELEKMRESHPIIPLILEYRELQKLLSTYIDNLPKMLGDDSRLHASFHQDGTTTGRLSSSSPNLQNIPIKTELGRRIRNAFVAEDGFTLAAFDYSQIELRVAAFMSGDSKLVKVFKEGGDVHSAVAAAVFNVPLEKVDYEMRRKAKVINFGILYGMGVNALRANLKTSREEAQKYLNDYFEKFSELSDYLEKVKKETREKGYTETLFGRRRYFPAIKSKIDYIRSSAERMAINAPLQGTSADIIKLAMVKIEEYIKENNFGDKAHLVLQIHDELVYEIKNDFVDEVSKEIKNIMENAVSLEKTKNVPLLATFEKGKNWGEMKD